MEVHDALIGTWVQTGKALNVTHEINVPGLARCNLDTNPSAL